MKSLRQALSVARKDLAIELRTKESLNAAGAFAIAILLLFSFAFDPFAEAAREMAGGLLWLVFAFAGALIFNRGFARELPNECLETLLASPLSTSSLLLGKAFGNFVMLLALELISLFVFGIFYDVRWWLHPLELAALCALATWGISIVGAIFGALTVNLRLRELMLPVIIYPLLIPLLIAAIEITDTLLANRPITAYELLWGRVLVVFDIVFTALALALAETILVNQ
ncbi:MAG: heme exporter protein CcmB [Acidobacteriaceae bacterium]|nr:heme exporter protein CcmB [Acidobacteriaceae bacterium]MBV9295371.1 heme exporter protein CcmB [Acidobacteriaceae bacterium]MBV9763964.1 heme exporter protein CcmB [Acidobacteriaceae bacterium]